MTPTPHNRSLQKKLEKKLGRAITCLQKGELKRVTAECHSILKLAPEQCDALHCLALVEKQKSNYPQAIKYFERAVTSNASQPDFYYNLAVTQQETGLLEPAKNNYLKALSLQPDYATALDNLGAIYQQTGEHKQAANAHRQAVELNPQLVSAYNNLGEALRKLGQYDEAVTCYQKAVELRPDFLDALTNLGNLYKEQGDMGKAMKYLTRALEHDPSHTKAYCNMGNTLMDNEQHEQGIEHDRNAVETNTAFAVAHWKMALALLLQGRYQEGWFEYEWGFAQKERTVRDYPYPVWNGEELHDKTLLILGEQGIGDEIMFASCIPDILNKARNCIIECDERLAPVFKRSFPAANILPRDKTKEIDNLENYPEVDFQIPVGSLPRLFRNKINEFPRQQGYLLTNESLTEKWHDRLTKLGSGLKIGISWRGGNIIETQQKRSTQLEQWCDLFAIEGVHFINLQYGDCAEELEAAANKLGMTIHDWADADPLKDMDGFLAQVAALDLVISIDNSTVHVAGSLGIPVWTLLPYIPDWRWKLDSMDTPWYASMTLLRQSKPDNWAKVFVSAANRLQAFINDPESGTLTLVDNNTHTHSQQALLLNDTSDWYHWGCTCTSGAILSQLSLSHFKTSSLPINDIHSCRGTPTSAEEFDSEALRKNFFEQNSHIIDTIATADIIVINGEGTLHNLGGPALNLLYLAYISKTVLGKSVHIINHSCYPEDRATASDTAKNALYKKVYQTMDSVAVRESISADLLESLGINVIRSFDCLPLYLIDNDIKPATKRNNSVVIAGSVSWAANKIPEIIRYMQSIHDLGYSIKVLTGARAYPASDDSRFIDALSKHKAVPWELVDAKSAAEWLHTIGEADLLVSGRFHHSIAAAFLQTPFIALNSNTPKMDGLMQMLKLPAPINFSDNNLLDILLSRSKELLESPSQEIVSEQTLESLRQLAMNNFDNIGQSDTANNAHERRKDIISKFETDKTRWSSRANLNPD